MRIDSHHSFTERYSLEYLETILKRNRFEGSVLAAPVPETVPEFVRAVSVPDDLSEPARLDGYQRHPKFRAVCHRFGGEMPAEGLGELERRGIALDAEGGAALIAGIAERFPGLRMAMDHLGWTAGQPFDEWARDLERAAQRPLVFCKLSGLARMGANRRPYVQHALAVFGPRRLMFGSDWPAGLPEVTWKGALALFTQAIGAQPIEVREELLGGTAERFYGI